MLPWKVRKEQSLHANRPRWLLSWSTINLAACQNACAMPSLSAHLAILQLHEHVVVCLQGVGVRVGAQASSLEQRGQRACEQRCRQAACVLLWG
jgi:hypothetical protein